MARLILPSIKYKRSFLRALKEYHHEGRYRVWKYEKLSEDFSKFVRKLKGRSEGKYLPKSWVAMTYYWLVEKENFIGEVTLRHRLNERLRALGGHIGYSIRPSKRRCGYGKLILELCLQKAKKMGFKKVLLTCDEDNIASLKIIEFCKGRFQNKVSVPGSRKCKLRFWITL